LEEIFYVAVGISEQRCPFKLNGDVKMYFEKNMRSKTQLWIGNMLSSPGLMYGSETLVQKDQDNKRTETLISFSLVFFHFPYECSHCCLFYNRVRTSDCIVSNSMMNHELERMLKLSWPDRGTIQESVWRY
jgi:hypothetical protein